MTIFLYTGHSSHFPASVFRYRGRHDEDTCSGVGGCGLFGERDCTRAGSVSRCDADGTLNDEGAYAKVTYNVLITALNNINTKLLII